MPKRIAHTGSQQHRRHFIRQWREYRGLTQDQLAERLDTSKASISRIENFKQPYTQDLLEALADALMCEPADLIMRDPTREDAIWSIYDQLEPAQRNEAIDFMRYLRDRKAG